LVNSDDTDGVPPGFKCSTLGLEPLASLVELPVDELIALLGGDGDLCNRVMGQSYDKRYQPSTFIEENGGAFRVGWYQNGYQAVRTFAQRELAVADYLLFSFGKGRLPKMTLPNP